MNILNFNEYDKLNEYFHNNSYNYETIFIEIKNLDDLEEVKRYFKKRLYPTLNLNDCVKSNDVFSYIEKNISIEPYYIRIDNKKEDVFNFGCGKITTYYNKSKYKYNHERLFTIHDVRRDFLRRIITYGKSSSEPTYKPRRIDKTTESVIYNSYRFKTEKEFEKTFGSNWRNLVAGTWTPDMDYLLGTRLLISFPDDKKFVLLYDESGDCWYISRDMLVLEPSYEPRKTNKDI